MLKIVYLLFQLEERSIFSSKNRALRTEIKNTLEEEVKKAFWRGIIHLCGLFLALAVAFALG